MAILIFIIIIGVLVFVHELGHFIVAKLAKMRVDSFAIGFQPTLYSWKRGETTYKLNAIPLGGYVSIYGEDPSDEALTIDKKGSFSSAPHRWQALVLVAGVTMNLIFALLAMSAIEMIGHKVPYEQAGAYAQQHEPKELTVEYILPKTPAAESKIALGSVITKIKGDVTEGEIPLTPDALISAVKDNTEITLSITTANKVQKDVVLRPTYIEGKRLVGMITSLSVFQQSYNPLVAISRGFNQTVFYTKYIVNYVGNLISGLFTGHGNVGINDLSGPVGIVKEVKTASAMGFVFVLFLAALISINLAIVNILPFPALDGGRLVVVFIEGITRRKLNPSVVGIANIVGFVLLILLMVVVTVNDIFHVF